VKDRGSILIIVGIVILIFILLIFLVLLSWNINYSLIIKISENIMGEI